MPLLCRMSATGGWDSSPLRESSSLCGNPQSRSLVPRPRLRGSDPLGRRLLHGLQSPVPLVVCRGTRLRIFFNPAIRSPLGVGAGACTGSLIQLCPAYQPCWANVQSESPSQPVGMLPPMERDSKYLGGLGSPFCLGLRLAREGCAYTTRPGVGAPWGSFAG